MEPAPKYTYKPPERTPDNRQAIRSLTQSVLVGILILAFVVGTIFGVVRMLQNSRAQFGFGVDETGELIVTENDDTSEPDTIDSDNEADEDTSESELVTNTPPTDAAQESVYTWSRVFSSSFNRQTDWSRGLTVTGSDGVQARVGEEQSIVRSVQKSFIGSAGISGAAYMRQTGFDFRPNDAVRITSYWYLPSTIDYTGARLIDLECRAAACTARGPIESIGIQLGVTAAGTLQVYSNSLGGEDTTLVAGVGGKVLPRDRWFPIVWEVRLGNAGTGYTTVHVDGVLDIDLTGTTIASVGYAEVDHYDTVEVGITANTGPSGVTLYADDVVIEHGI